MPKTKGIEYDDSLAGPFVTKKEVCFLRMQNLYELAIKIKSNDMSSIDEFVARVSEISEIKIQYEEAVRQIIHYYKLENPDYVPTYGEITSFDQLYYAVRSVANSLPHQSKVKGKGTHEGDTSSKHVRLPELSICHFDGKIENWPIFRDTFVSLIHENSQVSDIDKFYYLPSAVSGPALSVVKSVPVTAANYQIVWCALHQRYQNKRLLATSYLDKLVNFKPMLNESRTGLNAFLLVFQENVKALEMLNIPDLASFLLFYLALRNLDATTRREFEQTVGQGNLPTFNELISFVEKQVRVLELSECKTVQPKSTVYNQPIPAKNHTKPVKKMPNIKTSLATAVTDKPSQSTKSNKVCAFCQKPHTIYRCFEFLDLTPEERFSKIKVLRLCENCLRDSHTVKDCPSKLQCAVCKQHHHHTLHIDSTANQKGISNNSVALTCSAELTVLLGTAMVHVADSFGKYHSVRVVIDSGAMSSYITQDCANRLGLKRSKCKFTPIGLGGVAVREFGVTTCTVKPRDNDSPVLTTEAVVVSDISGHLPVTQISNVILNQYRHFALADPTFYKPGPIDMLLAGDVFPYIYDGEKIMPRDQGMPVALKSIFGYIITGQVSLVHDAVTLNTSLVDSSSTSFKSFCGLSMSMEQIMHAFWEVESVPAHKMQSPDDIFVEEAFAREHSRAYDGRYVVKYPMRPLCALGSSTQMAIRRLLSLESKLDRQLELKQEYHKFMREYEELGHMTCLGDWQGVDSKYIIPHFCIFKPSSTTTKLRVVFDASASTTNGNSLNLILFPGPKLQADINEILIHFRLHQFCLSADVCKMYRQILIDNSQRGYQHILWRYATDQPKQVFELNTVTYGVASSPYLAIKVLHTLADEAEDCWPVAAEVLRRAFFMDDFLWSVDDVGEAIALQQDLRNLLQLGGFVLRKWSSNSPTVLQHLPDDYRETPIAFEDDQSFSIKVLGLQWSPATDTFSFVTATPSDAVTKRSVLSQIGRLFDPLGFVAPCVFFAKCLMQQLWALNLGWDDPLPVDLRQQWLDYVVELPLLSNFNHERHATVENKSHIRLLGFCDASSLGYAAVIYLYTTNDSGDSKVSLLIAKSKVAPLKTISIPRLELMAAHLLAKLVKYVVNILSYRVQLDDIQMFTDSSVVLAWLNTPCHQLKTFVASRISKILDAVTVEFWYHIAGVHNPADIASRGALPSTLLAMTEWLSGPAWLTQTQDTWPIKTMAAFKGVPDIPELKPSLSLVVTDKGPDTFYALTEKFSSFHKLTNVVARCLQFIGKLRKPRQEQQGLVTVKNWRQAQVVLIKAVQQEHFANDLRAMTKGEMCQSSLRKLCPFVDSLGCIRVGGRLSESRLPYDKKHPWLLPKKCNFTHILIDYFHKIYLHVGPRTLQSILSQRYWIVSARSVIRSRLSKCISCFKAKPTISQPVMGTLPKFRSEDIHPFHTVGIDIGGPFSTKESNRRNAKVSKAYLCLFVCCATRAVHLETQTSLSTDGFLAALDRFTSRRGLCHTIVSDNGRNFVGAGSHLKEVVDFYKNCSEELYNQLYTRKITWKYNPPTGSHFGGLYESGIKSTKTLLKRVVGVRTLSFEELTTLFTRVEAVLNSRPLASMSNDPNEFEALTPGHFLVGRELLSVPEYRLTEEPINRLDRWQAIQQASQRFWQLWKQDYLHTLQQRHKWFKNSANIKVGDLVLVHSSSPPLEWNLGRVTDIHPGPDAVVRVVEVRTKNGRFIRPVVKLSPLPLEQDAS